MKYFFLTLFFLATFFAPLGHDLTRYSLPSSLLWNDSSWVFIFLALFCLVLFFVQKNFVLRERPYLSALLGWAIFIFFLLIALPTPYSLESVLPLFMPPFVGWFFYLFGKKLPTLTIVFVLLGILTLQAQWGLVQFSLQRDIGLSLLGESPLSPLLPGVAKFSIGDTKLVRAYGPYQHANAFGGAMASGLALTALAWITLLRLHRRMPNEVGWYLLSVSTVLFLALLVSFSRTAYAYLFLTGCVIAFLGYRCSLLQYLQNRFSLAVCRVFAVILLPFIILVQQRTADPSDMALLERQRGYEWFVDMFHTTMWFTGVGLGNYSSTLTSFLLQHQIEYHPWEVAPVHNSFLLLGAEMGVFPALAFLVAIILTIKLLWQPTWKTVGLCLLPFLPLVLFDHYLLSLPSSLVLALVTVLLQVQMMGSLTEWPEQQKDAA